jgi:hypothetical protein
MSTRSYISRLNADGTVTGVYCHFDGYPEGVGEVLHNNYTTPDQVRALLELGDLSSLGDTIDETIAYHRDRGEALQEPCVFGSIQEMTNKARDVMGAEWAYVHDDNGWKNYRV